ncbi:MAG TPA: chemotaxis response regulator protein-glutamate methylesterase [Allocoleopsis sp.]
MKIAIVNDLPIVVAALRKVVQTVPDYQIIWTAKDGAEAVDRCTQNQPDLILMDLIMPVMGGVEATRQIMQKTPCGILIVTASTEKHVERVYEAMCYGALDAVDTPVLNVSDSTQSANTLLAKIATLRKLLKPTATLHASKSIPSSKPTQKTSPFEQSSLYSTAPPLIAIGSSTGGPKALATVLSKLPIGFNAAIAVVQHVDAQFSAGLVSWLNQQIALPVRIAKAGESLEPGTVLVAGTNDHLYIKPDLTLGYTKDPIDYPYRPSVDVFFKSLSGHWTRRGTAVLLTGMGRDGAEGLLALRERNWHTIAQDKSSCVVYGMPKAAAELNAAVEVLSPEAIATALLQVSKPKR